MIWLEFFLKIMVLCVVVALLVTPGLATLWLVRWYINLPADERPPLEFAPPSMSVSRYRKWREQLAQADQPHLEPPSRVWGSERGCANLRADLRSVRWRPVLVIALVASLFTALATVFGSVVLAGAVGASSSQCPGTSATVAVSEDAGSSLDGTTGYGDAGTYVSVAQHINTALAYRAGFLFAIPAGVEASEITSAALRVSAVNSWVSLPASVRVVDQPVSGGWSSASNPTAVHDLGGSDVAWNMPAGSSGAVVDTADLASALTAPMSDAGYDPGVSYIAVIVSPPIGSPIGNQIAAIEHSTAAPAQLVLTLDCSSSTTTTTSSSSTTTTTTSSTTTTTTVPAGEDEVQQGRDLAFQGTVVAVLVVQAFLLSAVALNTRHA